MVVARLTRGPLLVTQNRLVGAGLGHAAQQAALRREESLGGVMGQKSTGEDARGHEETMLPQEILCGWGHRVEGSNAYAGC
jgi:hypothetical protein